MSKQLLIALANAASALANVALQVAQQDAGTVTTLEVTQPEPEQESTPTPAPRGRGRPRKEETVKEPEPEQEPETAAEEDTNTTPAKEEIKGKTLDELKAIIKPAVEAGKGAGVKAIIAKYAGEGKILKDLAELPEHHEAFEKAVKALTPVDTADDF